MSSPRSLSQWLLSPSRPSPPPLSLSSTSVFFHLSRGNWSPSLVSFFPCSCHCPTMRVCLIRTGDEWSPVSTQRRNIRSKGRVRERERERKRERQREREEDGRTFSRKEMNCTTWNVIIYGLRPAQTLSTREVSVGVQQKWNESVLTFNLIDFSAVLRN